MGCTDAGTDIVGIQKHHLITTNQTEELWSDDKNWVFVYSTVSDLRQGGVGILYMSRQVLAKREMYLQQDYHCYFLWQPLVHSDQHLCPHCVCTS